MTKYERPSGAAGFGDMFSDELNPGEYTCKFIGKEDCEIPVYQKPGEVEAGVAFQFEINFPDEPPTTVYHKVRAVISTGGAGSPSKLYKLIMGMLGTVPGGDLINSDIDVEKFFQGCIGKSYSMLVGAKPMKKGGTKPMVISVSLLAAKGKKKPVVSDSTLDDIPFGNTNI